MRSPCKKLGHLLSYFGRGAPSNFYILSLSNMTFRFLEKSGKILVFHIFFQIALKIKPKLLET